MQDMLDSIGCYSRSASVRAIEYKEKTIINVTVHTGKEMLTALMHVLPHKRNHENTAKERHHISIQFSLCCVECWRLPLGLCAVAQVAVKIVKPNDPPLQVLCVPFTNSTGVWAKNNDTEAGCFDLSGGEQAVRDTYGDNVCQKDIPPDADPTNQDFVRPDTSTLTPIPTCVPFPNTLPVLCGASHQRCGVL
jgi:hypothetical protein